VRNGERIKNGSKAVHLNQKPLSLSKIVVSASSDEGDVVWEPFGGMCTTAIASLQLTRRCFSAEILPDFFRLACERLETADA
jgi:site-specific DNA-methyltransferase (adenine-specific)